MSVQSGSSSFVLCFLYIVFITHTQTTHTPPQFTFSDGFIDGDNETLLDFVATSHLTCADESVLSPPLPFSLSVSPSSIQVYVLFFSLHQHTPTKIACGLWVGERTPEDLKPQAQSYLSHIRALLNECVQQSREVLHSFRHPITFVLMIVPAFCPTTQ